MTKSPVMEHMGSSPADQTAQRLASIVESSDDAIVSKDLNGIVVSWNGGAQRLFGYSPDDMIGRHISVLIPADRQNEEPSIIERIRRGERVDHFETIRRRKDGSLVDISLTISPIHDETGRVIGASKIARDISQRKQAEATQQLLLNELNHRVKNTLASVQAIAYQTQRSSKDPADFVQRFSGRIQSLAKVHTLLTETTWKGADLKQLAVDQLIQGPVDPERLSVWGPPVHLDPQMTGHIAMMLHELGTNSVKYGALSLPAGRVSLSWVVRDDLVHIKWVERGGPPVTAPPSRGFGTTLIEQSAKSKGGSAKALFEPEGVTWEISVQLPAAAPHGAAVPPYQESSTPRRRHGFSSQTALSGKRVLVVEDEPIIAMDIVRRLEGMGARSVVSVGTSEDAVRIVGAGGFDLALLDANLHGLGVDDVAAALAGGEIPFIFVTGYGRAGLPEAFGDAPLLSKPFGEVQLLEALGQLFPLDQDRPASSTG